MKAKLHLVFSISIFFISFCSQAQQSYWKSIPKQSNFKSVSIGDIGKAGAVFALDDTIFSKGLERTMASKNQGHVVYLPNYDGKVIAFTLKETPVFHPDLTKKYPGIRSFSGISLDGNHSVKLSSSQKGLQSMIVNLKDRKTSFMEPLANRAGGYVVYEKGSSTNKDGFICDTEKLQQSVSRTIAPLVNDQLLRRFRIAVSTTGEYTDFHDGTVAGALAAINATLTRINGIFETDLGVTLELIANNDLVIFTDASTDPYTGNLNSQVQSTLTSIIGEANYDVGHLFDKVETAAQNNGNAGFIGSVCSDNRKGSAFSSTSMPEGDVFDVDFVAHELGHQFGANHTWSFETEGTGVQAEPASGTTIMGYAGITGVNNVEPNSDDYFHFNSVQQIVDYLGTVGCAQTTALTNSPPVVTPMGDYIIPKGTAFVLEGAATDADVGDVLTYTWEQVDDGVVTNTTFGPNNAGGANFRSLPPTTDPARYFPRLSRVVSGNLTQTNPGLSEAWETVSNIERDLNFAFTVRDNATGGGQLVSDLLKVEVLNSAGPFTVTSQASNEVYDGGSTQEITWDVANTNVLPINAQRVDIFLSLDGGVTFPITLADDVLNDGSEEVVLPGDATNTARIMVKASDNVFFAVNASDFTIQETNVVLSFQELSYQVCQPNDIIIPFTYQTFSGFSETSTFSADLPAGLSAAFSPTQASANDTAIDLTISDINAVSPGTYPITVTSTSTSVTQNVELTLVINDGNFSAITLLAPTDAQTDVSIRTGLSWEANDLYAEYDVEIATDVGFASIVESATVPFNFYQTTNLIAETEYFWRVRPRNNCGTGTFSSPFSFTTIQLDCTTVQPNDLPLEISAVGTSTITSTVQFSQDLPIADINVNLQLSHTFLSDLIIDLIAPSGTRVTLISTNCGDLDNLNAVFDDDGTDIVCSGNPAISGTVSPLGSLASLIGESTLGEWTLEIRDVANGDGGALETFELEVCVEGALRPDDDGDGVFDDGDDLCLGTPPGVEVDVTGCPVNRLPADNFTVQIESETCRDNNDGFVSITAVDTSLTYTAVLDGNGNTFNMDFTDSLTFENLSAGSYSLCITGTDGSITYQETCFSINVAEPELLSASAVMASGVLEVTLSGASLYNVELNGLVTQTEETNIILDLKEGLNTLRVFTNLPCQGSYENSFFFSSAPILYPNPVETASNVFLNGFVGDVEVQVFTSNGRVVMNEMKRANGTDLEIDFSSLPTGIYYMRIQNAEVRKEFKLIKE